MNENDANSATAENSKDDKYEKDILESFPSVLSVDMETPKDKDIENKEDGSYQLLVSGKEIKAKNTTNTLIQDGYITINVKIPERMAMKEDIQKRFAAMLEQFLKEEKYSSIDVKDLCLCGNDELEKRVKDAIARWKDKDNEKNNEDKGLDDDQ